MATEKTKMNSLDLYKCVLVRKEQDPSFDGKSALRALIHRMADELMMHRTSELLNASVYVLGQREHLYAGHIYHLNRFDLDLRNHPGDMSPADAAVLVRCLADLVSGGQIRNNVIYEEWYESFGTYGTSPLVSAERAFWLVQMTDRFLADFARIKRPEKTVIPITETGKTGSVSGPADNPAKSDELLTDAQRKAEQIIREAKQQAEDILEKAGQEAAAILNNAQNVFDARMAEADQRIRQMKAEEDTGSYESMQNEITASMKEIRRAINEAGLCLNQIDQKINDEMIRKIFAQYDELYHLIADVAESVAENMDETGLSAARVYQNHRIYLDMIEEYLADFGIEPIISEAGETFDGRRHEAAGAQNFDPRNAAVAKCLRHGFMYGNTVLKKELVELEGEQ